MPHSFKTSRVLVVGMMLWILAGLEGPALAQSAWPRTALPNEARIIGIGEQMTLNGLPMRIQGFVSAAKVSQLADWFRRSLGRPLVESKLADSLILGRPQGDYYLTIQLESAGIGTRGLITVTHLKAAYDSRSETLAANAHTLARLPSGSRVTSELRSEDGGKRAQHLVIINGHSTELNLEHMKSLMREDGLALQYEATADSMGVSRTADAIVTGKTLFFRGQGKEAIAVIYRENNGQAVIVLNTVALMERPE